VISFTPIKGVYLSSTVDLKAQFGKAFESVSDVLNLHEPQEIADPSEIRFALSWKPADDAFAPYPNLEMVSSIAAGVDNILNCPSLPADVIVTRICDPDQAYMMAGFTVWQVIWYHRNMRQYLINNNNHVWNWVDRLPIRDYTVGILGFGTLGQAVARALVPLGFPVVAACRTARTKPDYTGITLLSGATSIRNTAERANILINLLPLTAETRFVLNANLFAVMPRGSVLIQIGRGEHLKEADLIGALDNGQLSAATLDVFGSEPLPSDHPFWDDLRIMVTPHDASEAGISIVIQQVASCVAELAQGRVLRYAVDRSCGY
jgi:glyoxylate/hydroxypyruvate reductase A